MAVLIDPPTWPAHGTTWSHLVSTTSPTELHALAAELELPRRGFDLDHYDVPAHRYADAVAAGAIPTGGRELTRALLASGLRVPGRDRPMLKALRRHWIELVPGGYELGDDLLARWREPHRVYHGPLHLTEALDAVDVLLGAALHPLEARSPSDPHSPHRGREALLAHLALWFHDAVHTGSAGADEEASALLAVDLLPRHLLDDPSPRLTAESVASYVAVTTDHSPGRGEDVPHLVSDADLAILAASPGRYAEYTRQVRAEYAHVPDDAFREGRAAVLTGLLESDGPYATAYARRHWGARAEANLRAELTRLEERPRG